ncbi:MAG: NAD(P)H-hydrate dehydratase [Agathobacter sp.]|nr:NAD(P)H-hydrate dehydratase [Agathobacter sp.]
MKYLVTGKEMKLLDQNTSNYFKVPELVLMEQAAMHFVWRLCDVFKETIKKENPKGIVFCGTGNNGADGFAIARLLNQKGIYTEACEVNVLLKEKSDTSVSNQMQKEIYQAHRYPIIEGFKPEGFDEEYDFIIDAIFGIGLSRPLNQAYMGLIEMINHIKGMKIAVDIPSGINADDGQIMGAVLKCDHTITFSFGKLGQYLWPGCEYAGTVHVVDMGITEASWLERKPSMASLEKADLSFLPKRPAHSNKGTFGKLLVIAGSVNMAGAAIFVAKAAYRCGVGLVKVFTREENRGIIQETLPEALVSTYTEALKEEQLIAEINWADAVVVGPGIGMSKNAKELVRIVQMAASVPVVWDADALNILAEKPESLLLPHTEYIMTPHLGEFSRLTNNSVAWIQNHLVDSAIDFARTYDVLCVLKDFRTVVANPYGLSYLNLAGNNGMATGGSGDVLAGIIGALLAQGQKGIDAAAFGTFIHGLAGDYAREKMGTHSMMASDIIESLKDVWKGIDYAE